MALSLAVDRDHDLVEMPRVAELRRAPTDLAGAGPAEGLCPAPHGLIADDDPARSEQVLDHPQAERTTEIEPDSLLDRARIADVRRHFVNLTAPGGGLSIASELAK